MNSVCLSIRPTVRALTLVNIFQKSWNLYILFVSDIEWSIEKMVCMRLRVCLQRRTKFFRYIKGRQFLKRISTYFTKCDEINIRQLDLFLSSNLLTFRIYSGNAGFLIHFLWFQNDLKYYGDFETWINVSKIYEIVLLRQNNRSTLHQDHFNFFFHI